MKMPAGTNNILVLSIVLKIFTDFTDEKNNE